MAVLPPQGHRTVGTSVHRAWCREHTAEGCLSAQIEIPDLPFAVWATTVTGQPDVVRVVIDTPGPDGAVVVDVRHEEQQVELT